MAPLIVNSGAYPYYPQPMVPAHPPPAQMQAPYPHPMNNPHGAVLGHPSNSQFRIPSFQPPPQHPLHAGLNRRRVRVVQSEVKCWLIYWIVCFLQITPNNSPYLQVAPCFLVAWNYFTYMIEKYGFGLNLDRNLNKLSFLLFTMQIVLNMLTLIFHKKVCKLVYWGKMTA